MGSEPGPQGLQAILGDKNGKQAPRLRVHGFSQGALKGLLPGLRLRQASIGRTPDANGICARRSRQRAKHGGHKAEKHWEGQAFPVRFTPPLLCLSTVIIPCGQRRPGLLCDGHALGSYTTSAMGTTLTVY
jgi:hypothetical protein